MHKWPLYYPEGKSHLWPRIRVSLVYGDARPRYIEPFFGSGAIGNELLIAPERRLLQHKQISAMKAGFQKPEHGAARSGPKPDGDRVDCQSENPSEVSQIEMALPGRRR